MIRPCDFSRSHRLRAMQGQSSLLAGCGVSDKTNYDPLLVWLLKFLLHIKEESTIISDIRY